MSQQAYVSGIRDFNFNTKTHLLPKIQQVRSSSCSLRTDVPWNERYKKINIRTSSMERFSLHQSKYQSLLQSTQRFLKSALITDNLRGKEAFQDCNAIKNIFSLNKRNQTHMGYNKVGNTSYSGESSSILFTRRSLPSRKSRSDKQMKAYKEIDEGTKSKENSYLSDDVESLSISDLSISCDGDKYDRPKVVPLCPLKPSLFPNVPPSFYFTSSEPLMKLPGQISRQLKWKLSSLTPTLIRDVVQRSGFKLVKDEGFWASTWGRHIHCHQFRLVRENQKVNHFPGTFHMGRKDRLWLNISKMQEVHGNRAFSFMPQTFILPQQMRQLEEAWTQPGCKSKWIIKPPASARGIGVSVIHRWTDVPQSEPVIVQKYINQPYLINGTKFDLRLYVLVTSFDPLRLYMFDDGLVRFASVKYSKSLKSIGEKFIHLTNYSINRTNSCYTSNEDENTRQGHKWTLKTLWSYFRENNIDDKKIWSSLVDVVIKTLISCEDPISRLVKLYAKNRYVCYELFGFDVMLDNSLKPWLLEVNITPSLHSNSQLDEKIKAQLIKDTLNTVGIHIPHSVHLTNDRELEFLKNAGIHSQKAISWNKNLYRFPAGKEERVKQCRFEKKGWRQLCVLKDLTPDDVRQLVLSEDELARCGNFIRVFPSQVSSAYLDYFETTKYYNLLLDAWERKYQNTRDEGIDLLRNLCKERFHLRNTASNKDVVSFTTKCKSNEIHPSPKGDSSHRDGSYIPKKVKNKSVIASKLFPLHLFSSQPEEV